LLSGRLEELPQAVPHLLLALDFYLTEPCRAVVAGEPGRETRALLRAVHSVYRPDKVVLGTVGAVEPFSKTLPAKGAPLVYLCTGSACQPPADDAAKVRELLKAR
jgi:uncharacterized protein YyaL (SSP411 family)